MAGADLWDYNAENRFVGFSNISSHLILTNRKIKICFFGLPFDHYYLNFAISVLFRISLIKAVNVQVVGHLVLAKELFLAASATLYLH